MTDARRYGWPRIRDDFRLMAARGLMKQVRAAMTENHRWLFVAGVSMIALAALLPMLRGN